MNLKNEKNKKKVLQWLWRACYISIIFYVLIGGRNSVRSCVVTKIKSKEMMKEYTLLKDENNKLRSVNNELKNNPKAVEKLAREKFGMQKSNEKVYRFYPTTKD